MAQRIDWDRFGIMAGREWTAWIVAATLAGILEVPAD